MHLNFYKNGYCGSDQNFTATSPSPTPSPSKKEKHKELVDVDIVDDHHDPFNI
jgi:hypothetical protein